MPVDTETIIERYNMLNKRVELAAAQLQRAKGALESMHTTLRQEFGVESLEAAEELLTTLQDKEDKLAARLQTMLSKFEEVYGDKL